MNRIIWKYGLILAVAIIGLKFVEYTFFSYRFELETYLGIVAVIFLSIGLGIGYQQNRKYKNLLREQKPPDAKKEEPLIEHPLTKREVEIIQLVAQGNTNQDISDKLYISLNTAKTHISNIYQKLEVKNRAEATLKAKELKLLD